MAVHHDVYVEPPCSVAECFQVSFADWHLIVEGWQLHAQLVGLLETFSWLLGEAGCWTRGIFGPSQQDGQNSKTILS